MDPPAQGRCHLNSPHSTHLDSGGSGGPCVLRSSQEGSTAQRPPGAHEGCACLPPDTHMPSSTARGDARPYVLGGTRGSPTVVFHGAPVWSETPTCLRSVTTHLGKGTPQSRGTGQRTDASHPNFPPSWPPEITLPKHVPGILPQGAGSGQCCRLSSPPRFNRGHREALVLRAHGTELT